MKEFNQKHLLGNRIITRGDIQISALMTLHREIMNLEKESNKLKCLIFEIIKNFSHKIQIRVVLMHNFFKAKI